MRQANQVPFMLAVFESSKTEPSEVAGLLDLTKYGFNYLLAQEYVALPFMVRSFLAILCSILRDDGISTA